MRISFNTKWVIICLLWAGSVIITCFNVSQIDKIKCAREKKEIFQADNRFWKKNFNNISSILKKNESFYQTVNSLKIGFLSVENSLKALAEKYDLSEMQIDSRPDDAKEGKMPVKLSFKGSFADAAKLLDILQKDFSYLLVNTVKIFAGHYKQTSFEVSLFYRYKVGSDRKL